LGNKADAVRRAFKKPFANVAQERDGRRNYGS